MNHAIRTARIDVTLSGRLARGKVTADQSTEHRVAAVRHDTAIERMCQTLRRGVVRVTIYVRQHSLPITTTVSPA